MWSVILIVLALTTLPYLYAYLSAPPGRQFMGIMVNVPDHAQYFSWYRQYLTQDLAANILTPEPNQAIFFNLLWWLLAKVGAALGWDYAAMFQVLRGAATTAFLWLLYRMCAWFLPDLLMRRTAFLLAVLSSGFGWALIVLKYLLNLEYSLEALLLIFIVEPNSFFGILATPHLVGAALYMFAFDLMLRGEVKGQWRYAVFAGLFTQFLGWQHAYDLLLVYGILGAYGLLKILRDRRLPWFLIGSGTILGVLSFWPGLYSFLLTNLDPIWRNVLAQFDNAGVFTPAPWLLPVLLGPAFLLALFTLFNDGALKLRGLDDNTLFLKAWFWGIFVLVYLPTDYQIKMLNGWQVPIAILATQGLFRYVLPWLERLASARGWHWRQGALRLGLSVVCLAAVAPTNIYLYAWRFYDLSRHDYPYYLSHDELDALEWLRIHAAPNSVVLASLMTGQYVPALTGQQVFLAHWAQTVDYYAKDELVREVFSDATSDERREAILREYEVSYLLYGPNERALGDYQPARSLFLGLVYSTPLMAVYQIQR